MPKKDIIPCRRHYKRTGQAVVTLNGRDIYLTAPYTDTAAPQDGTLREATSNPIRPEWRSRHRR